ncbi:MAG: hypothetical protein WKI04_14200 [Ferruginibacter sp.]
MDVYDAAVWSAITPMSKKSIEMSNQQLNFPITNGQRKNRKPVFALKDNY